MSGCARSPSGSAAPSPPGHTDDRRRRWGVGVRRACAHGAPRRTWARRGRPRPVGDRRRGGHESDRRGRGRRRSDHRRPGGCRGRLLPRPFDGGRWSVPRARPPTGHRLRPGGGAGRRRPHRLRRRPGGRAGLRAPGEQARGGRSPRRRGRGGGRAPRGGRLRLGQHLLRDAPDPDGAAAGHGLPTVGPHPDPAHRARRPARLPGAVAPRRPRHLRDRRRGRHDLPRDDLRLRPRARAPSPSHHRHPVAHAPPLVVLGRPRDAGRPLDQPCADREPRHRGGGARPRAGQAGVLGHAHGGRPRARRLARRSGRRDRPLAVHTPARPARRRLRAGGRRRHPPGRHRGGRARSVGDRRAARVVRRGPRVDRPPRARAPRRRAPGTSAARGRGPRRARRLVARRRRRVRRAGAAQRRMVPRRCVARVPRPARRPPPGRRVPPRGLPGLCYWTLLIPVHRAAFERMARRRVTPASPHDARRGGAGLRRRRSAL